MEAGKNPLTTISIVFGIVGTGLAIWQYFENKELRQLQIQVAKLQLDRLKSGQSATITT